MIGVIGELVCRTPFPSRPVGFLDDPDGRRYHDAYFAQNPGMWTHGDLIDIDPDGSPRLHGRSDGVMNIDGVRIGPSEIYTVLRAIPQIRAAMAVEADDPGRPGSTRFVLLVVLMAGAGLDADLAAAIRSELRRQGSAAHVPSLILAVPELPVTHNGKPSAGAARAALNGGVASNVSALRNPAALDAIAKALEAATSPSAADPQPCLAGVDGDHTEAVITSLWRRALGPAAGTEHTFDDLGGTSRGAMTLVRQVRQVLGRDVLVADFLADPTLPGLIAAARSAHRAADASSVLRLAPGEAARPPLFIVQDVYGDLDVYWSVAQLLTGTGPVHGLRTALLHPDGTRRTIDELASTHATQIQEFAPTGPVRLAGYSFGGQVAYQVARLLTDAGRHVEQLVLIDTRPSPTLMTPAERVLNGVGDRIALFFPSISDVTIRSMLELRFRPGRMDLDARLFNEAVRMVNEHRPGLYGGAVTLLLASRRVPVVQPWLPAWRRIAPRLRVLKIPGAHHDVLGQQNVVDTAARFSEALAAG
jgi:acetoacetyl-CoA synthetase